MNFSEHKLSLEIRPDMAELGRLTQVLDEFWQAHSLDEDKQADLNIAVEEIVSNVIRHAGTALPIRVHVGLSAGRVSVEVQDSGCAFDPLAHPLPDPGASLEQRRAGGLGILMVTKMMDEVRYQRVEDRNSFTMILSR